MRTKPEQVTILRERSHGTKPDLKVVTFKTSLRSVVHKDKYPVGSMAWFFPPGVVNPVSGRTVKARLIYDEYSAGELEPLENYSAPPSSNHLTAAQSVVD